MTEARDVPHPVVTLSARPSLRKARAIILRVEARSRRDRFFQARERINVRLVDYAFTGDILGLGA